MKRIITAILALALILTATVSVCSVEVDSNTPDFIRGVDISSYFSLRNSGVSFKNYDGELLDENGFFDFLKSNSINYIRIRIWNDPYDDMGNGYGGGNCDIENAQLISELAAKHNMKILVDFHLSDFWADPSTQRVPKAWKNYSIFQKEAAVYDFVLDSLIMLNSYKNIGMVQIGNEINSGLCGENDYKNVSALLKSGFKAVEAVDSNILKAVHYTDPQNKNFEWIADTLEKNGVNYDVFASSYYSYWHGTTDNFTTELKKVADKYDKYVLCAETSYPFTNEDSDFFANNISGYESSLSYPVSINGQAQALRDTFNAVKAVGDRGLGVFYWEPAWITVGTISYSENYQLWEKYGSGWESSYASEYCDDGAKWHGGSSWDNQALFDKYGNPLDSLKVFSEFADSLMGDVDGDGELSIIDATEIQKYIVEIAVFSNKQKEVADIDNDSLITVSDATMIQKIIAQLI